MSFDIGQTSFVDYSDLKGYSRRLHKLPNKQFFRDRCSSVRTNKYVLYWSIGLLDFPPFHGFWCFGWRGDWQEVSWYVHYVACSFPQALSCRCDVFWYACFFVYSFIHNSLTISLSHSLKTHSLIHSLSHSFKTHSLTHSFTKTKTNTLSIAISLHLGRAGFNERTAAIKYDKIDADFNDFIYSSYSLPKICMSIPGDIVSCIEYIWSNNNQSIIIM